MNSPYLPPGQKANIFGKKQPQKTVAVNLCPRKSKSIGRPFCHAKDYNIQRSAVRPRYTSIISFKYVVTDYLYLYPEEFGRVPQNEYSISCLKGS